MKQFIITIKDHVTFENNGFTKYELIGILTAHVAHLIDETKGCKKLKKPAFRGMDE